MSENTGAIQAALTEPLPSLGDLRRLFTVILSEPEINAMHGVIAFADAHFQTLKRLAEEQPQFAPALANVAKWHRHYMPTLLNLSHRLERHYDDESNEYRGKSCHLCAAPLKAHDFVAHPVHESYSLAVPGVCLACGARAARLLAELRNLWP